MNPLQPISIRLLKTTWVCAAPFVLVACATHPAGYAGYDTFIAESPVFIVDGPQNARAAARCFEEQGKFLPLSEFTKEAKPDSMVYRLRVSGIWFEQILITEQGAGSRAEVRVASNLSDKWKTEFVRDRQEALLKCLGAQTSRQ